MTVTLLLPLSVTVPPKLLPTEIWPVVSFSTTVNVSVAPALVSVRLTPLIRVAWFWPRIAEPGAVSDGGEATVTAIDAGVADASD